MSYVTRRAPSAMLRFVKCIEKKKKKQNKKVGWNFVIFQTSSLELCVVAIWCDDKEPIDARHSLRCSHSSARTVVTYWIGKSVGIGSGFSDSFPSSPLILVLTLYRERRGLAWGGKDIWAGYSILFPFFFHSLFTVEGKRKKNKKKNKKIAWAAWILNARRPSDGFLFVCYNIKFIFSPPYVYYLIRCFQLVLTFYFWWVGCQAKDSLTCEWFIDENVWNKQTDGGGDFMLLWMDGFKK